MSYLPTCRCTIVPHWISQLDACTHGAYMWDLFNTLPPARTSRGASECRFGISTGKSIGRVPSIPSVFTHCHSCSIVETLMEQLRMRDAGEHVAAASCAAMLELLRPCHGAPAEARSTPRVCSQNHQYFTKSQNQISFFHQFAGRPRVSSQQCAT